MTDDDRLGPPPVEPLSDAAWSRVERGLWQRLDADPGIGTVKRRVVPSTRRWWIVAAPLAAAAAVAVIVLVTRPHPSDVDEPARVVSGASYSSVSFGDSHIALDPDSALAMSRESGRPVALLERGAAWFTVAPRVRRPEFTVRAGDAVIRVIGTRFRVARTGERIGVEVDHGVVDVQFRGSVITIAANQSWSSATPARISPLAGRTPAPVASEPTLDKPAEEAMPAPASTPPPIEASDVKRPPRPTKHDVKPAPAPAPALDVDPAPPVGAAPTASTDRERAEYDRLAALEPTRPDEALTGYLALARGTSRWADLALYAAARLAADRHDRRAVTLLGIYLQRFPDGANAADAKQLLARLKAERP